MSALKIGKSKNESSSFGWIVMLVLQVLVKVLLGIIKHRKKRDKN